MSWPPGNRYDDHTIIASGLDQNVAESRCKAPACAIGAQKRIGPQLQPSAG